MTFRSTVRRHWPVMGMGAVVVLCCILAAVAQEAASKDKNESASAATAKQVVKEMGKKGSGGADPNIKSDSEKNNLNQKMDAPPQKSAKKSRGAGPWPCTVHIDNRSPWIIRIYIDGVYRGAVNGYGDLYGITGNGPTAAYGVALFDDGSTTTWGPHVFDCGAGSAYSWGLYQ